ncbi:MAG: arylsulfatase [Bacteroidota bacterium]
MKLYQILALLLLIVAPSHLIGQNEQAVSPPNVVLILVDDAGLMDFGAFGGEAQTPNLDRLAQNGIMFTNLHASPVCAPSRAMLMTGSDSHLTGVPNLPEMLPKAYQDVEGYEGVLNDQVQTIATRLKERNYNTYVTGKWHLGYDQNTLPNKRGFDRSFILSGSGADNFEAKVYLPFKSKAQWFADGEETDLPADFYSSAFYVDQMIAFHEAEKNKTEPFFSFLSFQAVHAPLQAPREYVEKYKAIYQAGWDVMRQARFEKAKKLGIVPEAVQMNPAFDEFRKWADLPADKKEAYITDIAMMAGMLEAMDHHIGRYIQYLEEKGLAENTVFIATSDNGPDGGDYESLYGWAKRSGFHHDFDTYGGKRFYGSIGPEYASAIAAPFSYYKYYTGEGGLRVPLIIAGPDIPAKQIDKTFCFFTDIAPTIFDLAGISTAANEGYVPVTGKSMLPHIQNPALPIYEEDEGIGLEAGNSAAYFMGDYKIVKNNKPLGDSKWRLYNLKIDPTETTDLAAQEPLIFQTMLSKYETFAKEVGVLVMPDNYDAQTEVGKKSMKAVLNPFR